MAFGIGDFSLGDVFTMMPAPVQIVFILALSVIFVAAVDKALDTAQLFGVTGLKEALTLKTYMDDSGLHLGRPVIPSDRCAALEPRPSECFTGPGNEESSKTRACVDTQRAYFLDLQGYASDDVAHYSQSECNLFAMPDPENGSRMTYTFYNKIDVPWGWLPIAYISPVVSGAALERVTCDRIISICRTESEARIAAANATFTRCPDDWASRQSAYEVECVTNGLYLFDWKLYFYGSVMLMLLVWGWDSSKAYFS